MVIEQKTVDWLLEKDNPPVRYLTMTELLGEAENSEEVRLAKQDLMDYEVTKAILEKSDEFWNGGEKAYWKYTGKYWQIIFLGQFLANGNDPRIRDGTLETIEERKWIHKRGGQCLTANMLAAFIRLGFGDHPVVKRETENLAERIVKDRGVDCEVMEYSLLSRCHMSIPKQLLCFGLIPKQSSVMQEAMDMLSKELVSWEVHNYVPGNNRQWQKILKQAPKRTELPKGQTVKGWISERKEDFLFTEGLGDRKPKPGWMKFGFPLHYNSDILESMYALARVNAGMSDSLEKPLDIIAKKGTDDGRWILENSLNGKMLADVEEKGKPSKWVTFFALYVLNHFKNAMQK